MEDIEESRTSRKDKVVPKGFDASDGYEHANRTAKCKEGTWVEIELRIMYVRLPRSCRTHHIANPFAMTSLQNRREHRFNGSDTVIFL